MRPRSRKGPSIIKKAWILASVFGLLGLLFLITRSFLGHKQESPDRLCVILITIDALRPDHLGCYGYGRETSPVIDSLARQGVVFENALTCANTTLESLTSLLTGAYPYKNNTRYLHGLRNATNLPALMRKEGYIAAAFVGNHLLNPRFSGLDRYFDLYDFKLPERIANRPGIYERNAEEITRAAVHWLKSADSQKGFLLWLHYIDPHGPYHPPVAYRNTFLSDKKNMVPLQNMDDYLALPGAPREGNLTDANYYVDRYDEEIRYTDDQIGADKGAGCPGPHPADCVHRIRRSRRGPGRKPRLYLGAQYAAGPEYPEDSLDHKYSRANTPTSNEIGGKSGYFSYRPGFDGDEDFSIAQPGRRRSLAGGDR